MRNKINEVLPENDEARCRWFDEHAVENLAAVEHCNEYLRLTPELIKINSNVAVRKSDVFALT